MQMRKVLHSPTLGPIYSPLRLLVADILLGYARVRKACRASNLRVNIQYTSSLFKLFSPISRYLEKAASNRLGWVMPLSRAGVLGHCITTD